MTEYFFADNYLPRIKRTCEQDLSPIQLGFRFGYGTKETLMEEGLMFTQLIDLLSIKLSLDYLYYTRVLSPIEYEQFQYFKFTKNV